MAPSSTCWPSTGPRPRRDGTQLSDRLDEVWDQLNFGALWLSAVERVEAESAVERFLAWQEARADQELLGTEVGFSCEIDLGGERVHLTGTADRVERDPDGRVRIVDFKTGKSEPRAADVAVQDQLGVYQLAVQAGAFADVTGPDARPGGAELVYLRLPDAGGVLPKVFPQASLDDVPFPRRGGGGRRARAGRAADLGAPPAVRRSRTDPGRAIRRPARPGLPLLPVPRQLPGAAGRPPGGARPSGTSTRRG